MFMPSCFGELRDILEADLTSLENYTSCGTAFNQSVMKRKLFLVEDVQSFGTPPKTAIGREPPCHVWLTEREATFEAAGTALTPLLRRLRRLHRPQRGRLTRGRQLPERPRGGFASERPRPRPTGPPSET